MLAINLANCFHQIALIGQLLPLRQRFVDEVIKTGQLSQSDLAAAFVEAWQTMFAVANNIKRSQIYFCVETRPKIQVLEELRVVLQSKKTQPLATHRQSPVGKPAAVHCGRCLAAKSVDYRNLSFDFVR